MKMFMFKAADLVWIVMGTSGEDARARLLELIDREWPGAPTNDDRRRAVRDAYAEGVPAAVRIIIRTFTFSDMDVY